MFLMRIRANDEMSFPLIEPVLQIDRAELIALAVICILLVVFVYIVAYLAAARPEQTRPAHAAEE